MQNSKYMKKEKRNTKIIGEAKRLERYGKGVANHWRIAILFLLEGTPGLTTDQISELLGGTFKNISQHTGRLVHAGLLNKKHEGPFVLHNLSPYGKAFIKLLKSF